jgi:diguanylate cyclase (GGDEF)-like protein
MTDENVTRKGVKGHGQGQRVPASWTDAQDRLAASSGLAVLLVEGQELPVLAVANNNSICGEFQSSSSHAHLCEPFCGDAFNRAMKAGGAATYRCHAGLHCVVKPVALDKKSKLAVIGGRAFVSTADYRAFAERIRTGDLQNTFSMNLFTNVIFAANEDLSKLEKRISSLASEFQDHLNRPESSKLDSSLAQIDSTKENAVEATLQKNLKTVGSGIDDSCEAALRALADKTQLESLALLLRIDNRLVPTSVTGRFVSQPSLMRVDTNEGQLFESVKNRESLLMMETNDGIEMVANVIASRRGGGKKALELFPIVIANEINATLLVADTHLDSEKREAISSFCSEFAFSLEILRLREELERRTQFSASLQTFSNGIIASDSTETYSSILTSSTILLNSERISLLLFDEASNELTVKAALGPRATNAFSERVRLGDGVSGGVMLDGRPLIVRNLEESGRQPAPKDRRYKTRSFICYPILLRGRKLGVLNVTDKTDGTAFSEADLEVLETLAPQIALALDRADWQEKAAQFQLISITDPLTGLLNRRYLEERLAEELRRSERENYAMSFLMIDIDDFKFYNDRHGHQAGDLALEMTAQCLKAVLRGADVASRYGGEEFCILLPQTRLDEAVAIAERIRQTVEQSHVPHGKSQPLGAVTVSIGVSAFDETLQTVEAIIGTADRALYLAKRLGKNMVHVLHNEPAEIENSDANESAN